MESYTKVVPASICTSLPRETPSSSAFSVYDATAYGRELTALIDKSCFVVGWGLDLPTFENEY